MTSTKQQFLKKEPGKQSLAEWWTSICHDPRFDMVLVYARAETLELRPTQPQMEGANMMLATLLTLPDIEAEVTEYPSPGLIHHMPAKETVTSQKE